jgi:hypothetical protein
LKAFVKEKKLKEAIHQSWVQNRSERDAGENFRAATLASPLTAGVH